MFQSLLAQLLKNGGGLGALGAQAAPAGPGAMGSGQPGGLMASRPQTFGAPPNQDLSAMLQAFRQRQAPAPAPTPALAAMSVPQAPAPAPQPAPAPAPPIAAPNPSQYNNNPTAQLHPTGARVFATQAPQAVNNGAWDYWRSQGKAPPTPPAGARRVITSQTAATPRGSPTKLTGLFNVGSGAA